MATTTTVVWPGHEVYNLGILDGTDGFRVTGESSAGRLGYSVSDAGDVNNDGFQDVILGESPDASSVAGAAYVIFGSRTFSALEMDVLNLDGTNGFKVEGRDAGDYAGTSVGAAGDVNGDGFDDVVVGAWGASSAAGEVLVIFGSNMFPAVVTAENLNGTDGFVIRGATTSDASGFSVAPAGDVNSDGAADILVGAYRADPTGSMAGTAYVVFGSYSWSSDVVDLAELGAAGLMLEGGAQRDYAGYSVASAGDVNGDGYADVIIAAYGTDEAYVFYGAATFTSTSFTLSTLSGTDGFIMTAGNGGDALVVAGVGDINDDGYGDVAVGHALADLDANSAGAAYVVLGGSFIESPLDLATGLDGQNGFTLLGSSSGDRAGVSIADAGDINQDGYGDIVLGAPGVGDDEGAAYVVFGRSVFSYSYSLGNLTAENGVTLATSTVNGYAGCSVSGAGDMNQDGYPDLVVGAYGSGVAGEAYVVFPSLMGTPPPTPSPTPAPVVATPAPTPQTQSVHATPAPSINFLMNGVVGAGTLYSSPGVSVRANELGGKVTLGVDGSYHDDMSISVMLSSLTEKNAAGGLVGLGADIPHVIEGGGVVYEASATASTFLGGVPGSSSNMTSTILGGQTQLTVAMYVFEADGVITSGDEQTEVSAGDLKLSLSVTDWPFCDPSTVPVNASEVDPATVCVGAFSTLETGAYLDVALLVQGPSSSEPISSDQSEDNGAETGADSEGQRYGMSGGNAKAAVVMSEWVRTDDYGWTKAEELSLSGSSFNIRFPASSGTIYYDPIVGLAVVSSGHECFWTQTWFTWLASALLALVVTGLLLLVISTVRRRRTVKDKVSPSFEGVAPASETADSGKIRCGSGTLNCLKGALCCCRKPAWCKSRKAAPAPSSSEGETPTASRRTRFMGTRTSSAATSRAPSQSAGELAGNSDDKSAAMEVGNEVTEGPSGSTAGTPDGNKDLRGADRGRCHKDTTEDVVTHVSEALDGLVSSKSLVAGEIRGLGTHDDAYHGCRRRSYKHGHEDCEGHGHEGYNGPGCEDEACLERAGTREDSGELEARPASLPVMKFTIVDEWEGERSGVGSSTRLSDAASVIDAPSEREDKSGMDEKMATGTSPGATHLPPLLIPSPRSHAEEFTPTPLPWKPVV